MRGEDFGVLGVQEARSRSGEVLEAGRGDDGVFGRGAAGLEGDVRGRAERIRGVFGLSEQ